MGTVPIVSAGSELLDYILEETQLRLPLLLVTGTVVVTL